MSEKIFFGRLTRQVQEPATKHSQTASMFFTGTPKLASSQTTYLILCSPHKSLTEISKENVRLFCSRSVICHTKQLSCTSGDVSCRLCHINLLSADFSSAINTDVSSTVYPSSPRFSYTPFLFSHYSCELQWSTSHFHSDSSACRQHMDFTLGQCASDSYV